MLEAGDAFVRDKALCAFKNLHEHIRPTLCFAYHVFKLLYIIWIVTTSIHLYLPLATLKRIKAHSTFLHVLQ